MERKRTRYIAKCKIDRSLLTQELAKRGYSFMKASVAMGFSPAYLNAMLRPDKSELPQHTLLLLQERFGIRTETIMPGYVPKQEAEPINETELFFEDRPKEDMPEKVTPDAVQNLLNAVYDFIYAANRQAYEDAIKKVLG